MNYKKLISATKNFIISFISFLFSFTLLNSCTVLSNEPAEDSLMRRIEIYYPVNNSVISEGETEIEYSVSSPYNIRFIELYINGQFIKNIPGGDNNSLPTASLSFDSSFIGKSINYYLVYYDKDGTSAKSNDVLDVLIIKKLVPPYPPYDLRITSLNQNTINLSWKDSSDTVNYFEIYRSTGFAGEYSLLKISGGSSFNINDSGLIPDSIYFYKMKAVNDRGDSEFSLVVNTAGVVFYGGIYSPTMLKATAFGTQLVQLEWIDNSDNENFFRIERKSLYTDFNEVGNVGPDVTVFTDSGGNLYAGGTFFYRIKAFSSHDSAMSNAAQVTTYSHDLLAPAQLKAVYHSSLKIVELNWVKTDTRTINFDVERKTGTANYILLKSIDAVNTVFLDAGIQSGNNYYYRIRGSNGLYHSGYSNEVSVIIN